MPNDTTSNDNHDTPNAEELGSTFGQILGRVLAELERSALERFDGATIDMCADSVRAMLDTRAPKLRAGVLAKVLATELALMPELLEHAAAAIASATLGSEAPTARLDEGSR